MEQVLVEPTSRSTGACSQNGAVPPEVPSNGFIDVYFSSA